MSFDKWIKLDTMGEIHLVGEIDLAAVHQETLRRQNSSDADDQSSGVSSRSTSPSRKKFGFFGLKK